MKTKRTPYRQIVKMANDWDVTLERSVRLGDRKDYYYLYKLIKNDEVLIESENLKDLKEYLITEKQIKDSMYNFEGSI